MDPDTALAALTEALTAFHQAARNAPSAREGPALDAAEAVADLAADLLAWLDRGGFLPAGWQRLASSKRAAGTNVETAYGQLRQACAEYERLTTGGGGHGVGDAALIVTGAVERLLSCFDQGGGLPRAWQETAAVRRGAGTDMPHIGPATGGLGL